MDLIELGSVLATPLDFIRLLIVPAFIWIAWRDWRTRRVPNKVWPPFLLLGLVLFTVEAWTVWGTLDWPYFAYPAAISLLVVVPGVFLMWLIGGFGGADAKAIMTLAVLFPTTPVYYIGETGYPVVETALGSFAFTVLANAVVFAACIPLTIAIQNFIAGRREKPMVLGFPQDVHDIVEQPGKLLEGENGFTRSGLDLDVLRMYLRWRGVSVVDLRRDPSQYRAPETVPENPNTVTDGAVTHGTAPSVPVTDEEADALGNRDERSSMGSSGEGTQDTGTGERTGSADAGLPVDAGETDWWGAEAFLEDVDRTYGTDVETLRSGLEAVVTRDSVWVSPGMPFMLPIFAGLVTGLLYGNILFAVIQTLLV